MYILKIFCKAPIVGQVKTRLIPAFGAEAATRLHEEMSRRVINLCLTPEITELAEVELWCSPSLGHQFYDQFEVPRYLQQGDNLGQRMSHAFNQSQGAAILIGTDCANLDATYLKLAAAQLEQHDAIIGPAEDGGYGLIGLRQSIPEVITNIDWGTGQVCSQTCRRLNEQNLNWSLLPLLWDVDQIEDVRRYRRL